MKRNNPRWGARRIKGELRKIGITLSKSSICNILNDSDFPPSTRKFDETWIRFLKSHAKRAFACDFITVETAFLRRLYIFALLDINTREIVAARVTENLLRIGLNKPFAPVFFAGKFFPILLSPIEMEYLPIGLAGFSWISTGFAFTGHRHAVRIATLSSSAGTVQSAKNF